jgi:hypothetical protein
VATYNKVAALLCEHQGLVETASGPQLIKIVSLPPQLCCQQQQSIETSFLIDPNEHYANGFHHEMNSHQMMPPTIPIPLQSIPIAINNNNRPVEDEQFYEMIDDDAIFNDTDVDKMKSMETSQMKQQMEASSSSATSVLKKKYPKTNPNYVKVSTLMNKVSVETGKN